jgi:hypothetical protein
MILCTFQIRNFGRQEVESQCNQSSKREKKTIRNLFFDETLLQNEGEIKMFSDKQKLRLFFCTLALQDAQGSPMGEVKGN